METTPVKPLSSVKEEGTQTSPPNSPVARLERPGRDLEATIEKLREMYESATKLIIEKNIYGSPENLKIHFEKWLSETHPNYLNCLEEVSSDDGFDGEVSSSDEELYMPITPVNSEDEEEDPIYEVMAPLSKRKDEEDAQSISAKDSVDSNAGDLTERVSSDSKCCLTCFCVNVANSLPKEEEKKKKKKKANSV